MTYLGTRFDALDVPGMATAEAATRARAAENKGCISGNEKERGGVQ
jgi:hypothetical protein